MGEFTMTFEQVIMVVTMLAAVFGAFWKLKLDIKKIDIWTKTKIAEMENNLNAHKELNREEFERYYKENREDHAEIKGLIKDLKLT